METKELRLGNLLHYDFKTPSFNGVEKICEVKEIMSDFIKTDFADDYIVNFKPITITEDWVKKFGFIDKKYSREDFWYEKGFSDITILINKNTKGITEIRVGYNDGYATPEINYVHELQNLYYSLTKDELAVGAAAPLTFATNVLRVCAVRGESGKNCRNGKQYEDK